MATRTHMMPQLPDALSPCMAKLDRVGWAAGTCIDAYGARIGIRVNCPSLLDRVQTLLPPGWKPLAGPRVDELHSLVLGGQTRTQARAYNLVYWGIARRARTLNLDEALAVLEADLRLNVAAAATRRVFVHAGVVAHRGRAIVLPGRSGAGKSTLVAALLRAGATYYSDEFAVLDARGRVYPFAKPLSLRDPEGGGARSVTAEQLGSASGVRPLRTGLVALTSYRPSGRWRPARLTPGGALMSLLAHTVPVRRRPEESLRSLTAMVEPAIVLKSPRGEAGALASLLLEQVDALVAAGRGRGRVS
jgi:energy-coupling factor transporter ATP-binding protein EcfA2